MVYKNYSQEFDYYVIFVKPITITILNIEL